MSKDSSDRLHQHQHHKKGEAELLTRRRDKRRHLSSTALDLRNPLQVLELAVRFDESRQEEDILMEPLEKGKLHDQKQFLEALRFLERQTKPPTTLDPPPASEKTRNKNNSSGGEDDEDDDSWNESPLLDFLCNLLGIPSLRDTEGYPDYALTPIILSGLISNARNEISSSASSSSADAVGELVMTCQTMRRAAIRRVRNRHLRFQIQRNILPAASFCLLFLLYIQWIRETLRSLEHLRFMDEKASCEMYDESYQSACQLAEAHLWSTYEDYLLIDSCRNSNEDCLRRKFGHGALALQARFSRQLIPVEDVLDDTTILRRDQFHLGKIPRSQSALPEFSSSRPYQWMGASAPLAALGDPFDGKVVEWNVLDVGCGVGGTLWHLLPDDRTSFSYHGIALSRAEIFFAKEMVRRQGLQHEQKIQFRQQNFDDPLPRHAYNLMIAVESLSFSPNLENTIANLVSALKPGGVMVVADEFALPPVALSLGIARRAPSMHTFLHYSNLMDMHGCKLKYIREYGLEYQMEGYHTYVPQEEVHYLGKLFYPWLPGRSGRLYQLRKDQDDLYKSFRHRKADESAGRTSYAMIVCRKPRK